VALLAGVAVKYPLLVEVRERRTPHSQPSPLRLEKASDPED